MVLDCCICGEPFTPDRVKVDAWGMSGEPFEPTDWECGECSDWLVDYDPELEDVEF
jgi:hypothetical protein